MYVTCRRSQSSQLTGAAADANSSRCRLSGRASLTRVAEQAVVAAVEIVVRRSRTDRQQLIRTCRYRRRRSNLIAAAPEQSVAPPQTSQPPLAASLVRCCRTVAVVAAVALVRSVKRRNCPSALVDHTPTSVQAFESSQLTGAAAGGKLQPLHAARGAGLARVAEKAIVAAVALVGCRGFALIGCFVADRTDRQH